MVRFEKVSWIKCFINESYVFWILFFEYSCWTCWCWWISDYFHNSKSCISAWLDRGDNVFKWIKTRTWDSINIDLLNSFFMISMNDQSLENKMQVIKIVVEAVRKYVYSVWIFTKANVGKTHCSTMKSVDLSINNKYPNLDNDFKSWNQTIKTLALKP